MGQRADEIRALGADVLAVAVTATFAQQAFAADLGVDFPVARGTLVAAAGVGVFTGRVWARVVGTVVATEVAGPATIGPP